MRVTAVIVLAGTVSVFMGCEENHEDKVAALTSYVQKNQISGRTDVWLATENALLPGTWDRVALFFGYADDYAAFTEFAAEYVKRYRLRKLRCSPVR